MMDTRNLDALPEVLATLLRVADRLEGIERLLRDYLEHNREIEQRRKRMLAAINMIAGNGTFGDE